MDHSAQMQEKARSQNLAPCESEPQTKATSEVVLKVEEQVTFIFASIGACNPDVPRLSLSNVFHIFSAFELSKKTDFICILPSCGDLVSAKNI
mmetsp:Transcript_128788/g.222515  ORF Transcript_128788/g.222515 Transcript_128788/m.222515 type:complete len:93 (+) Transcript_128788:779-1057(+)